MKRNPLEAGWSRRQFLARGGLLAGVGVASLSVPGLLEACGSGSGNAASTQPVSGGTLTWAVATETGSLDPAKLAGGGTVGGVELQAIYDTIVRWNPATATYEMRTAQSLTPNADFTQWTLKLKPGIAFGDGTAYDAAAVKFNIERQMAASSRASQKALLQTFIGAITAVDAATVRFDLKQPWAQFPYLLSRDPGMIASPAAIQKAGASWGAVPDNSNAGPFNVKSYKVGESITVVRNPNYYGAKAYLDGINFVVPPSDAAVVEQDVKSGQFQAAYIIDPAVIANAASDGLRVVRIPAAAFPTLAMNCFSGPTSDVNVRQAVAAAIDPKQINARVYNGALNAGSALIPSSFAFDPKVPGPAYDPNKAKDYLARAKSNGFTGTIRLLSVNTPQGSNFAVAVKSMLDAVGFNTVVTLVPPGGNVAAVLVQHNYDLAFWSLSIVNDDGVFGQLFLSFSSQSKRYGYSSPDMDAALAELRVAASTAAKTAALKKIATVINRDMPMLVMGSQDEAIVTTTAVSGIEVNSSQNVVLNRAWMKH